MLNYMEQSSIDPKTQEERAWTSVDGGRTWIPGTYQDYLHAERMKNADYRDEVEAWREVEAIAPGMRDEDEVKRIMEEEL